MAANDDNLVAALGGLYREVNAFYGAIARDFGLTAQQIALLCQVKDERPTFGELASSLGCDKTNITGMVDRLERRGYVARQPDPEDRRISRVALTAQGVTAGNDIRAAIAEKLAAQLPQFARIELAAAAADLVAALSDRGGSN
ncbi:MarR family winged helix-turn-helix transcriptional regulator [Nocardia sp. NBC_00416]|uniref:MarR family winged helix-turn-helix transcriptional regulator n=1 Tax=Nocardia sp. NBC_00416 TaxID=2975991 RepID=UPI002E24CD13